MYVCVHVHAVECNIVTQVCNKYGLTFERIGRLMVEKKIAKSEVKT